MKSSRIRDGTLKSFRAQKWIKKGVQKILTKKFEIKFSIKVNFFDFFFSDGKTAADLASNFYFSISSERILCFEKKKKIQNVRN